MQKKYRLLVFDWDGTLMDSAAHITQCMQAAARDLETDEPSTAQVHAIIGLGMDQATRALFPGCDDVFVKAFRDRYREHFFATAAASSDFFAGAKEAIAKLHEAGYLLAVATGKSRRGLDAVFNGTGIGRFFHTSRCADETESKPDPLMLNQILQELDIAAEQALMIGDTVFDLEMARSAGVPSLGVSYGVHDVVDLKGCDPVAILDDIRELWPWLHA